MLENQAVQLVGDGTGAVPHLGDRLCSLQRRRQELAELASAPKLAHGARARLLDAAVKLGQSARDSGLPTVEFLAKGDRFLSL